MYTAVSDEAICLVKVGYCTMTLPLTTKELLEIPRGMFVVVGCWSSVDVPDEGLVRYEGHFSDS